MRPADTIPGVAPTPMHEPSDLDSAASTLQVVETPEGTKATPLLAPPQVATVPAMVPVTALPAVKTETALAPAQEPIPVDAIPASITVISTPNQTRIDVVEESAPAAAQVATHALVPNVPQRPPSTPEPLNLATSGLIMIETIPKKIKQIEAIAPEEPAQPKQQRERPRSPPEAEHDPLVQIETHK